MLRKVTERERVAEHLAALSSTEAEGRRHLVRVRVRVRVKVSSSEAEGRRHLDELLPTLLAMALPR